MHLPLYALPKGHRLVNKDAKARHEKPPFWLLVREIQEAFKII